VNPTNLTMALFIVAASALGLLSTTGALPGALFTASLVLGGCALALELRKAKP